MRQQRPKPESPIDRRARRGRRTSDDPFQSSTVWDRELEEEFVGWLIANPERAAEVCGGGLRHEHFHGFRARTIFHAIEDVVEASTLPHVDALVQALTKRRVTDVTKVDLVSLLSVFPVSGGWEDRARLIRDGARRRALVYAFQEMSDRIAHDDLDNIRGDLYAVLDEVRDGTRPVEADSYRAVMEDVWNECQLGSRVIRTGIGALDAKIRGVRRGTYIVLGARTSVGKTALAVTLATRWAQAGLRVSMISVEMDRVSVGQRYAGTLGTISVSALASGEVSPYEMERLSEVAAYDLSLATDDTSRTMAQVRSRVMQHRRLLGGLDVVFVDYVQLLQTDDTGNDEKRYRELGRISQQLKFLGRDIGCIMVVLAQLNRTADARKRPRSADLRESGNLEQDADQVWLLWRNEKRKCIELIIDKNRQGPTCVVPLSYVAHATRFEEWIGDAVPADEEVEIPAPAEAVATTPDLYDEEGT